MDKPSKRDLTELEELELLMELDISSDELYERAKERVAAAYRDDAKKRVQ